MNFTLTDQLALAWILFTSVCCFILFGFDKRRANRNGRRVPESRLLLLSAIGGWLGGLAGMLTFRHKTRKLSFLLKFFGAFAIFASLIAAYMFLR